MAALNLTEGVTKKLDLILERLGKLDSKLEELNKAVKGLQGKILYFEAYSHRENLKFEGIPELPESSSQQNAIWKEEVLVNFMENILEIEDAKDMEFQRVHRIGKPKSDNGNGS